MAAASGILTAPYADDGDRRGITLLTIAHLVNDANQSALPALILWLSHRGVSLALGGTLVLAMNFSSSIVQPLFGHWSDRRSMAWVIPAAVLVATGGMAIIGFAPSFAIMLVGALISGIGVAAFHPEGSRFSNYFAGAKRASGMSVFTLGGYLGFAFGPVAVTPLINAFGLHGIAFLLVPAVIISALVWRDLPRFEEARRTAHRSRKMLPGQDDWRAFLNLTGVVALRSMTFLAAVTFLPIFAERIAHASANLASLALTLLLLGGAAGTIWGGRLADRIDRRRVVAMSLVLTAIFGGAIALAGSYVPLYALIVLLAAGFGTSLGLSAGVIVLIGQEYLPERIGVASGVTLGLAVTIGGLAAPVFGWIGDTYGLVQVFGAVTLFAVLAFGASFFLSKPRSHQVGKS
ncbi:MAG: MFS transporter [Candidatus Eremiobacteraeota bacterium]|nr:MFS transporter [Candidatus Eremiobacteraeota bacterium]